MTDHPHAEPTTCPYKLSLGGVVTAHWSNADWPIARFHVKLPWHEDRYKSACEAEANASLFVNAPATAAERDRLVKVNERLADVLEKMMAGIHAMREGDVPPLKLWQELWDEARAALAEAQKP